MPARRSEASAQQQLFYALAEPTRRDIVEMLATNGQLTATEISDNFTVSPQAISQHLKVLREAEVVSVERRAQKRIYKVNPDSMREVSEWASKVKRLWEGRFEALDGVLEAEKKRVASKPTRQNSSSLSAPHRLGRA